ncbi:Rap1a/Tai family immunity protein [Granulosicoccus antarcticus]|uniref:Rap1a immunity protein domain-containing protein n=1 Tax=Granulosicoccus antarcticus IMCC3135 TaxID=1192854 RepID=A0A2Z2NT41_9GAMM|nr:Rap1a/Tai family immunity protein [Granulosicoccus antarcticus]ASJ73695.1 hypothetical protein IMCC3135_18080 [Granulosicoccus antarcticus IMCC3135]
MTKFCGTGKTSSSYYSENARCSGYVIGVVDTITQTDAYDDDLCLPDMVTVGQLTKVVEKSLAIEIELGHKDGMANKYFKQIKDGARR